MEELGTPNVTAEKIFPYFKKANPEQMETVYRVAHHLIRGTVHQQTSISVDDALKLFMEGSDRQRLLIFQVAYHLIQKSRMA